MVDAYAVLDSALDPSLGRPRIAPDVEIAVFRRHSTAAHAVVHNPRTQRYYRVSGLEAELARSLDGSRTVSDIAVAGLGARVGDPQQVVELVDFLRRRGCLTEPWTDAYAALDSRLTSTRARWMTRAWDALRTATVTIRRLHGAVDLLYRLGGRWVFTRWAQVVLTGVIVGGLLALVVHREQVTVLGEPTAGAAATLWGLGLLALMCHEAGHALAIRHAGRRILGGGFGLYFGHPVFFIDSSDMVMASPRARAVNAIAGPYAEFAVAGVASLLATLSPYSSAGHLLFRFAALTFIFGCVNLVPFLELDGYWLVTDVLDLPDLRPRALAFLRHELPSRLRERLRLTRAEWGLLVFGILGVLTTVVALALAVVFWWPILKAFGSGLWGSGAAGRVVLVLLLVLVAGPLTHGLGGVVQAMSRTATAGAAALRFRLERGWRVAAGELLAALPLASELDEDELNELAGRVTRRRVRRGEAVVRAGEAADSWFVVRRGTCAVVETGPDGADAVIARRGPGDSFGELALLRDTPRTATVRAETEGEVFVVDRATFTRLLAPRLGEPSLEPADWPVTQVWSLPPFRALDLSAASALAHAGRWMLVGPGEELIRQGDQGDALYVVASGQLDVLVDGVLVSTVRAGEYVGETALLHDVPRTATVRARTPARLFAVPREAFRALLLSTFGGVRDVSRPQARTHSAGPA